MCHVFMPHLSSSLVRARKSESVHVTVPVEVAASKARKSHIPLLHHHLQPLVLSHLYCCREVIELPVKSLRRVQIKCKIASSHRDTNLERVEALLLLLLLLLLLFSLHNLLLVSGVCSEWVVGGYKVTRHLSLILAGGGGNVCTHTC